MNKTKILIISLASFSAATTATAITVPIVIANKYKEKEPEKVVTKKLVLDKTSATIKVGETLKLIPKIEETTTNSEIKNSNVSYSWSSDDINIATVDNKGIVTPIKYGNTSIRVFADGMYAKCDITVKDDEYHDISFTYSLLRVLENDINEFAIPYTCSTTREVSLESSDTNKLKKAPFENNKFILNPDQIKVGDKITVYDSLFKDVKCEIEVIPSNDLFGFVSKVSELDKCQVYCLTDYSEEIEEAIIPSIHNGKIVNGFYRKPGLYVYHSFYYLPNLKKVEIPSTIENMDYAFAGCGSNVKEGMEVKFLDESRVETLCFSACNIKSINIPSTVKTINENCFSGCSNLSSVTFSPNSSLTNIKKDAFSDCRKITSIEIPESCQYIEAEAFKDCTNLSHIKIPSTLTNVIGETSLTSLATFHNCRSLKEVYIDSFDLLSSNDRIEGLFDAPTIYVNKNVDLYWTDSYFTDKFSYKEDAGDYYLYTKNVNGQQCYTYELDEENSTCKVCGFNGSSVYADYGVVLPETVEYTENKTYTINKIGLDSYNKGFKGDKYLNYIKLSNSITEIEDSSFEGCNNLYQVELNEGLKTIGKRAFANTFDRTIKGLRYIHIPSTVTSIGFQAFLGNNYMDEVKVDSSYAANLVEGDSITYLYNYASIVHIKKDITLEDTSYIIKSGIFELSSTEGDYNIYTKKKLI